MKWHVGIVDIGVAAVVLFAIFLPDRAYTISPLIPERDRSELLSAQSDLASTGDPQKASYAAEIASRILTDAGQHDLALRVAGPVAAAPDPRTWRASLGVALTRAERLDIVAAYENTKTALQKCDAPGSECPIHESTRLDLLLGKLRAGVKAIESGLDPRDQSEEFRKRVEELSPTYQFRISPRR